MLLVGQYPNMLDNLGIYKWFTVTVRGLGGIGILAEFVSSPLVTRGLIALPLSDTSWEVQLLTYTSYAKARKNRSWNWWGNDETRPVC